MKVFNSAMLARCLRRMTAMFVAVLLAMPGIGHAAFVDVYLGFNFVGSSQGEMELRTITYTYQPNGPPVSYTVDIPNFPGASGMVDGRGVTAGPGVYSAGGDGETTRTIGETISINWSDFTGTGVLYPHIYINSFTYANSPNGPELTGSFGDLEAGYLLGLIPDNGVDTELQSSLAAQQSDIYSLAQNGTSGNLVGAYTSENVLQAGGLIFSAAAAPTVVPVPAAVWLFGSALGLMGWMRRRG